MALLHKIRTMKLYPQASQSLTSVVQLVKNSFWEKNRKKNPLVFFFTFLVHQEGAFEVGW